MKILDFALVLGELKKIKRTGWVRVNIPNAESVAEHSFRVAVLSMILAPQVGADINKVTKMALIHDIGEAEIGDIDTGVGAIVKANIPEKIKAEKIALVKILNLVDSKEYVSLFDEYQENKTKEAQLVKQVDKLEMAIQALEYEQEHKVNLQEFFNDTSSKVTSNELREIFDKILRLRKK